jgi:hypothetical protein
MIKEIRDQESVVFATGLTLLEQLLRSGRKSPSILWHGHNRSSAMSEAAL